MNKVTEYAFDVQTSKYGASQIFIVNRNDNTFKMYYHGLHIFSVALKGLNFDVKFYASTKHKILYLTEFLEWLKDNNLYSDTEGYLG